MSLSWREWKDLERALCRRFGLDAKEWTIERGKASRYRYWVTLWGPEAKRISTRGLLQDVLQEKPSV